MSEFDFIKNEKLRSQLDFLMEIDKMKNVFRRTLITDGSRRENDAEHSWHFAMFAMILSEYSTEKIDTDRAIRIGLVHDLVEVYAGDVFAYDTSGQTGKHEREAEAADRLFGMLESGQAEYIRSLWDEFEEKKTPEARFANVCDRLQPLMHNFLTGGHTWKEGDVHADAVRKRMSVMRDSAPELADTAESIINEAVKRGLLKE